MDLTDNMPGHTSTRKVGWLGAGLLCFATLSNWAMPQATAQVTANSVIVVPNHATYEVSHTTFVGDQIPGQPFHSGKLLHAKAPFGSGPDARVRSPMGCPLQSTINSFWPTSLSSAEDSQMMLHKEIDLPTDSNDNVIAKNVRLLISVDNLADVYFNGTFVKHVPHGGCPKIDEHPVLIPDSLLRPTNPNTLDIIVTDIGTPGGNESYFDLKMLADVP